MVPYANTNIPTIPTPAPTAAVAQGQEFDATEASLIQTVRELEPSRRLPFTYLRVSESAVSRVPEEILTLIFKADPHHARQAIFVPTSKKTILVPFAVVVSHVSRAWRDAAIRDPFLWTKIRFMMSEPNRYYHLYVERSQSRVLDISVACNGNDRVFDPSILHLHRCRKLSISFDTSCNSSSRVSPILRCLATESAPHLESFKIDLQAPDSNEDGEIDFTGDIFAGGAPILSSVKLYGISPILCRPPLGAVTHLKLRNPSILPALSHFYDLLYVMASSLTHLSLAGMVVYFEGPVDLFVDLPALISLDIRLLDNIEEDLDDEEDVWDNYISRLWECLKMPALETLSMCHLSDEQLWVCSQGLYRQNHGAKTTLKSLSLENIKVDEATGDEMLQLCPNILEFSLTGAEADPIMGVILKNTNHTNSFATAPPWPSLRRIAIALCNDELLRTVVLARKAAGHPIAELCLDNRLPADQLDWFRQHVETVSTVYFTQ
jgi:hypothetical protein